MLVRELFENVAEIKDPKTMTYAEISAELDILEKKDYAKMLVWERQRRANLRNALKDLENAAYERQKAEREAANKDSKKNSSVHSKEEKDALLHELYMKAVDAIGLYFPDGDPWDFFGDWMDRRGLTKDDLDKVFRKYEGKSYNKYNQDLWDDYASQECSNANELLKTGKEPPISNFYSWDGKSKKVTKARNPWKAS